MYMALGLSTCRPYNRLWSILLRAAWYVKCFEVVTLEPLGLWLYTSQGTTGKVVNRCTRRRRRIVTIGLITGPTRAAALPGACPLQGAGILAERVSAWFVVPGRRRRRVGARRVPLPAAARRERERGTGAGGPVTPPGTIFQRGGPTPPWPGEIRWSRR